MPEIPTKKNRRVQHSVDRPLRPAQPYATLHQSHLKNAMILDIQPTIAAGVRQLEPVRIDPHSPKSAAPQSCNLRVGPQLPLDVVTTGPEDDAGGAPGLEVGETFAQLLASP